MKRKNFLDKKTLFVRQIFPVALKLVVNQSRVFPHLNN
jgi:hypothetical protein